MILKFKFKKETKGTYVYEQVDDNHNPIPIVDAVIPTIYIRKSAMPTLKDILTIEIK